EPGTWTSRSQVKKAMGGFFLEELTVIDAGPAAPAPIVFRSFYGYDAERGKYMSCGVGNMGMVSLSEIHWVDENTMVSAQSAIEDGSFVTDRWITTLEADGSSFVGQRAVGGGEFFEHVQGQMRRSEEPFEAPDLETAPGLAPAGPEMQRLNRMAGRYRLSGSFQIMPGAPPMEVSGDERMRPLFGGCVLEATVHGDPIPEFGGYEAWAAFAWDPAEECYACVYVNSMGEISKSEARWVGDCLVSTHAVLRTGQPSVSRGIVFTNERGAITKVLSHSIVGDEAPFQDFEGTYVLQKE
ncbi:MAG: DUF1579 family protein, partial [Planctomycetes bacterium]|nr:DUF1579 family protein [Planctomycetota bacterium]